MTETSGCRPESDDDEEKVDDHSEALGNEEKFLQEYGIEQCSCMHKLEMLPNTAITIVWCLYLDSWQRCWTLFFNELVVRPASIVVHHS